MSTWHVRLLDTPQDMKAAEILQMTVWSNSPLDVVPDHVLVTLAHNGSPVIGAFNDTDDDSEGQLIGVAFGFPGLIETPTGQQFKYCSHQMGVHPDFEGLGIGFALKRAQWQMARQQGYQRVTWTYDPLLSRNAYLNIAKLGAVCNTYYREIYGEMRDGLNVGFPSDRFQVDWWLLTPRVEKRLSDQVSTRLTTDQYIAGGAKILNPGHYRQDGSLSPQLESPKVPESHAPLVLVEIPPDFQTLKKAAPELALAWRLQTRELFETLFTKGYFVTDFIYQSGPPPRSFYVLSYGNSTF